MFHTHTHTRTRTHTNTHTHTRTHRHMYARTHALTDTHTHARTRARPRVICLFLCFFRQVFTLRACLQVCQPVHGLFLTARTICVIVYDVSDSRATERVTSLYRMVQQKVSVESTTSLCMTSAMARREKQQSRRCTGRFNRR